MSRLKTTILGNGRFGKYLAELAANADDIDFLGVFDKESSHTKLNALRNSELLILAVPISQIKEVLGEVKKDLSPSCHIMDTCSVKLLPASWLAQEKFREGIEVVGSHPLFGPQSAPGTCQGQKVAVTPIAGNNNAQRTAIRFWRALDAHVILCSPEDHDRQIASQALNHFVGRCAANSGLKRVELSTKTNDLFMNIVDIVNANSIELFKSMIELNPYAQKACLDFTESCMKTIRAMGMGDKKGPTSENTASPVSTHSPLKVHHLVLPEELNHHGTLFGGAAMALADKSAFIAATIQYPKGNFVTKTVGAFDFTTPARAGDILEVSVEKMTKGTSSLTIQLVCVNAISRKQVFSNTIVMVNVGANGHSSPLE